MRGEKTNINNGGVHGPPIAEFILSSLLALSRHLPLTLEHQRSHKWGQSSDRPTYASQTDWVNKRVGIAGYGSIVRSPCLLLQPHQPTYRPCPHNILQRTVLTQSRAGKQLASSPPSGLRSSPTPPPHAQQPSHVKITAISCLILETRMGVSRLPGLVARTLRLCRLSCVLASTV